MVSACGMSIIIRGLLAGSALCLTGLLLMGWGYRVHRAIHARISVHIPAAISTTLLDREEFTDKAGDADRRKSSDPDESMKHYIDIDEYSEFAHGTFPRSYTDAVRRYGESNVHARGILPWAIMWTVDSLTEAFRIRDRNRISSSAADLGHYIGDLMQPLHLTRNYDGQWTGNDGIHWRYESAMTDRYPPVFGNEPMAPVLMDALSDSVFHRVERGWAYHHHVLRADSLAASRTGRDNYTDEYYGILWEQTGDMTRFLFQDAAEFTLNLIFTAWVRAGQPVVTDVADAPARASAIRIRSMYPLPADRVFACRIELDCQLFLDVALYDMSGRQVIAPVSWWGEAGIHEIEIPCAGVRSGVYLCLVRSPAGRSVHKVVVQH